MPDLYSKWGVNPNDLPGNPVDSAVGRSVTPTEFEAKWGVAGETPAETPKSTKKQMGWADTWPVRLAKDIASGLTLPGDVYKGEAAVPHSAAVDPLGQEDTSNVGRLFNLANVIGTGAIPSVTRPGESSSAAINYLDKLTSGSPKAPLIDANTAELARKAREDYGIPIRGSQISANRGANYLDSVLQEKPFSGMAANTAEQHTAFNRSIAKTIGEEADKLTPEVMDAAKKRLGSNYERIGSQSIIKADDALGADLNRIVSDASTVLAPNERSVVHNQVSNILDKIKGAGEIDGKTYQALIKTGSPLDRATKSGYTNVKYYAGQVKQALIDALGRSVSPELKEELAKTNAQYKAMKTIEPLVEKSTTGDISPALLMGATRKSYDNMAYGGGGDLADLSRIGQRFLKEPPNSGTASRLSAAKLLGIGGLSGAEIALAFHDPVMAAKIAALATTGAIGKGIFNAGAGAALRSDAYANKLINSGLGQAPSLIEKLTGGQLPYNAPLPIMGLLPDQRVPAR